jgi:glyceraldehyde-3-phosphate dehydrogenase (NADP+)
MASSVIFSIDPSDSKYASKPHVDGAKILVDGKVIPWSGKSDVVTSPIIDTSTGERAIIGKIAHLTSNEAIDAVTAAKKAWNNGQGAWPQASVEERIAAIERLVATLKTIRSDLINVLQWEICKNDADAAAEFDRTVLFIEASIAALREASNQPVMTVSGVQAKVRRAAIGVMLALGPFNYPVS